MRSALKPHRAVVLRYLSLLLVFEFLTFTSALALDPSRSIFQYAHSVWKIQDGFLKGVPFSIAQTTDGYLWIGTMAGMVRFDGVQFTSWPPPNGKQLPSSMILSLRAAHDGSLWIGTYDGLTHLVNDELINYPAPGGGVFSILEDHDRKIWFSLVDTNNHEGHLCLIVNSGMRCYGKTDGGQINYGYAMSQDDSGDLWIADATRILRGKPGSFIAYEAKGVNSNAAIDGVRTVDLTPDGFAWVGMSLPGHGSGASATEKWKMETVRYIRI